MSTAQEFYQCLICKRFLENLWKTESHISKHEDSSFNQSVCRENRGRLPIQKVIFHDCYIPVLKEKANLESFRTNWDVPKKRRGRSKGNVSKPSLKEIGAISYERPRRECHLKAATRLKELTSYLNSENNAANSKEDDDDDSNCKSTEDKDTRKNKRLQRNYDNDFIPEERRQHSSNASSKDSKSPEDNGKRIACPLTTCSFKYANYSAIAYHLKCHFFAEEKQFILTSGKPEQLKLILTKYKSSTGHPTKSKYFYCKFCLSRELSLESLQTHLETVHLTPKLNCPYCSEEFGESVKQLISHVKVLHQNHLLTEDERKERSASAPRFKCDHCPRILSSQQVLDNHIKSFHSGQLPNEIFDEEYAQRAYPCGQCHKRFKRSDGLRRHLEVHMGKRFACGFSNCNRKFSHVYALRAHRQVHLDFKRNELKCKICGAIFARMSGVRRHLEQVHKSTKGKFTKRYIFPRIKYSPVIKTALEEDKPVLETHFNQKGAGTKMETIEEEIELVDKIILTEEGEAIHLKGEELQPVNTSISTLEVRTSSDPAPAVPVDVDPLETRKYHKNNNYLFKCSICHAEFLRGWILQRHLKTVHQKTLVEKVLSANVKQEEPKVSLLCGLCAFPAKDKCDLKKHMKSHGPIRKFKCFRKYSAGKKILTCGKSFESEEGLNSHIKKVHDSEKKYKCEKCGRGYSAKNMFKNHVDNRHCSGEKKHCKECDKYYTPASYYAHMKRHREEGTDKFKCMLCGDNLSCKRTLRQHIDLIHIGKSFDKKVQTSAGDSGESVKTESTATYCDKTGEHNQSILGI